MILNKTIKFCEFHHFANLTTLLAFSKSVKKLNKYVVRGTIASKLMET